MDLIRITAERFPEWKELQLAYKAEIGEDRPGENEFEGLKKALEQGEIQFYGCVCDNALVACCSICTTYSTFRYDRVGIFEDFYIQPRYRHRGIARKLVAFAYASSQVSSLSAGCADCDVGMYRAIGFHISLGKMLAYGEE